MKIIRDNGKVYKYFPSEEIDMTTRWCDRKVFSTFPAYIEEITEEEATFWENKNNED